MTRDIKAHLQLFVKLLFFTAVLVVPLIFYINVKQHYEFPKTMAMRFLMIPAVTLFFFAFFWRFWKTANPFRYPFALLLAAATLSALKSVNLCETMDPKYLTDMYLLLLIGHFLVAMRMSEKDVYFYAILLAITGMVSAMYGAIQFYQMEDVFLQGPLKALAVRGGDRVEPVAFQGNRNYSSEFYNLAFPMAMAMFCLSRRWITRIFFIIALFFIRYHLLISDTRATTVGLLATVPIMIAVFFWVKREEWPRMLFLLILYLFVEKILAASVTYQGFAGWPSGELLRILKKYLAAPMLLYAAYYLVLPLVGNLLDSDSATRKQSPLTYLLNVIQNIAGGHRSRYVRVVDAHLSLTRRIQHLAIFAAITVGILFIVISGTYSLTRSYHQYLIEEQLFRQRVPTYSSFFQEWLGPKTWAYRARHPDYEYKWYRDPIDPSEDWQVPGFTQFLKDRIDEKFFWDTSITFRIEVYNSTIHMIRDNIWLGIGTGTFKIIHDLYTSQLERFVLGKEVLARKVHNEYLSYAVKHGVFGLLALFWILTVFAALAFRIFYACRPDNIEQTEARLGKRRTQIILFLTMGLFWGMGITAFSMVFGHSLTLPTSHFLFWVSTGLMVVLYHAFFRLTPSDEKEEERLAEGQVQTGLSRLPGMKTFKGRLLAGLLVGLLLTIPFFYHWMGESFLQRGMQMRNWIEFFQARQLDVSNRPANEQQRAFQYYFNLFRQNSPHLISRNYTTFEEFFEGMKLDLFETFEKSLKAWPFHMETYYIYGRYCIDFNRPEKGIEVLKHDLFMNPNYKWAHNNIGVCFDQTGQYHRARDAYYRALIIDPQQIFAHFNLAQGYLTKVRNIPMAVRHFKGVLDSNPKRLDVYGKLAYCLLELQQYEQALSVLEDYVYLKANMSRTDENYVDDDMQNYQLMAELYRRLNQPEKALEVQRELLRLVPGSVRLRQIYVQDLMEQNQFDTALSELNTLALLQPRDARIQLQLAEATLAARNNPDEALGYLKKAVELGGMPIRATLVERPLLAPLITHPEFQSLLMPESESP